MVRNWLKVVWFPLFILLGCTWLLAPALHHAGFVNTQLISEYEALGQPYGWLFRVADLLAASLLIMAVYFRRKNRPQLLNVTLIVIGGLMALDALAPIGCSTAVCSSWDAIRQTIHNVESSIVAVLIFGVSVFAYWRGRQVEDLLFIAAQFVYAIGLLFFEPANGWQYVYQLITIIWLGAIVKRAYDTPSFSLVWNQRIRLITGLVVAALGLASLLLALPHRLLLPILPGLASTVAPVWLIQHAVISGLLLLFGARLLYRGQHQAAQLMAIVLIGQLLRYGLWQPEPLLVVINGVALALLLIGWSAFDYNRDRLMRADLLRSSLVVIVGATIAMAVLFSLANVTHRQSSVRQIGPHIQHRLNHTHEHVYVSALLGGAALVLVYSLLSPAKSRRDDLTDQTRVSRLLAQYSQSTEDYFKLWPADKQYFFSSSVDGMIAYRDSGRVSFGLPDPIASEDNQSILLYEFVANTRRNGRLTCFLAVPAASLPLYEAAGLNAVPIGSSAVIDVEHFNTTVVREKWWRWQTNRAAKAGWQYEALSPPHNAEVLSACRAVSDIWLGQGRHEQGFALGYFDEAYLQQCRLHLLRDSEGQLIAFANEMPVLKEAGQRTVDLIRFRPDHDGVMPTLIKYVIEGFKDDPVVRTFDLGFVPLSKLDGRLSQIIKRIGARRYSAGGLEQFKNKFRPDWHKNYLVYDGDKADLLTIASRLEDVLKAR